MVKMKSFRSSPEGTRVLISELLRVKKKNKKNVASVRTHNIRKLKCVIGNFVAFTAEVELVFG